MSAPLPPSAPADEADPFRNGWRFVKKTLPDGRVQWDRVPLTMEDLLHPQEDDVIPMRPRHQMECANVGDILRSRPLGEPITFVSVDWLVDWNVPEVGNHSPDVAVFVGLRANPDVDNGTLRLAEYGGRCVLAIEIVSPDKRDNDVVHKYREYYQVGVPTYVLVDQVKEGGPRQILGYHWQPDGFKLIPLDAQGRFLLPAGGIKLGLRDDGWLTCYDAVSGKEVGDYAQVALALDEADRRNQEQEKLLEETILRSREIAAERAAAEQRERDQAAACAAAEERIRQPEEMLQRLQGQPRP